MRTVLEKADYQVVSASSGAEALTQIKAEKPDLMLLDVMMATVTDGLDLSEQLRNDLVLAHLPIIVVSPVADTPHAGLVSMDEAIHMEAWVSKPIAPSGCWSWFVRLSNKSRQVDRGTSRQGYVNR